MYIIKVADQFFFICGISLTSDTTIFVGGLALQPTGHAHSLNKTITGVGTHEPCPLCQNYLIIHSSIMDKS
jgi:hypothetical protein